MVIWKQPVKLLIRPKDLEDAQDTGGNDQGRPAPLLIPSPQEIDELEKEEMKMSRLVVKSKLSKLHKCLDCHVPEPIKNTARK